MPGSQSGKPPSQLKHGKQRLMTNGDQHGLGTFKHIGCGCGLPPKRECSSSRQVSHQGIAPVSGLFTERARFA